MCFVLMSHIKCGWFGNIEASFSKSGVDGQGTFLYPYYKIIGVEFLKKMCHNRYLPHSNSTFETILSFRRYITYAVAKASLKKGKNIYCQREYYFRFRLFPLFWKKKVGFWDRVAVCVCVCVSPLLTFECLNQSLWNLVRISWHLSPSQRPN
jgi:hypothetical protein